MRTFLCDQRSRIAKTRRKNWPEFPTRSNSLSKVGQEWTKFSVSTQMQ